MYEEVESKNKKPSVFLSSCPFTFHDNYDDHSNKVPPRALKNFYLVGTIVFFSSLNIVIPPCNILAFPLLHHYHLT